MDRDRGRRKQLPFVDRMSVLSSDDQALILGTCIQKRQCSQDMARQQDSSADLDESLGRSVLPAEVPTPTPNHCTHVALALGSTGAIAIAVIASPVTCSLKVEFGSHDKGLVGLGRFNPCDMLRRIGQ